MRSRRFDAIVDGYEDELVALIECEPAAAIERLTALCEEAPDNDHLLVLAARGLDDGPGGECEACRRRASWIVSGGWDDDLQGPRPRCADDWSFDRPVPLCGWCAKEFDHPESEDDLADALRAAGARSMDWRWK